MRNIKNMQDFARKVIPIVCVFHVIERMRNAARLFGISRTSCRLRFKFFAVVVKQFERLCRFLRPIPGCKAELLIARFACKLAEFKRELEIFSPVIATAVSASEGHKRIGNHKEETENTKWKHERGKNGRKYLLWTMITCNR